MNCHCSFTQDVTEAQEGSQLDQKHPTVKQKKISLFSVGISENLKGDPTCIGPGMRSESVVYGHRVAKGSTPGLCRSGSVLSGVRGAVLPRDKLRLVP